MLTRVCSACREPKPMLSFSPGATQCKPCRRGPALAAYRAAVADPEGRKRVAAARMARYYNAKCSWVLRSLMQTFRYRAAS